MPAFCSREPSVLDSTTRSEYEVEATMNSASCPAQSLDAVPLAASRAEQRRAVVAGMVGYVLEWFDFGVYGFLAPVIAKNFFPSSAEFTSLLASFAVFGVGFVARPVGGVVFGRVADARGRQATLATTMILMAASTMMIGLLPTHDSIGVWAPVLLVTARLAQGFAAGGQWGAAAAFLVEWGGTSRRGFFGAFQQSSIAAGLLLASFTTATLSSGMSGAALASWGWRIPFLLGAILGPVGMYVRRRVRESPSFESASGELHPLSQAQFVKSVLHGFSFMVFGAVSSYMIAVYMPAFATKYAHLTPSAALWSATISLGAVVIFAPFAGLLSDRMGRKPLLIVSCVFFVLFSHPLYAFMVSGISFAACFMTQSLLTAIFILYSGCGTAALAEMFPTSVRTTGVAYGAGAAVILGGFSPFVTTWIISVTGESASAGWLLAGSAAMALPALIVMQDRSGQREI
jgi:MHS family proline/betaine transporter-like MFS transporter